MAQRGAASPGRPPDRVLLEPPQACTDASIAVLSPNPAALCVYQSAVLFEELREAMRDRKWAR